MTTNKKAFLVITGILLLAATAVYAAPPGGGAAGSFTQLDKSGQSSYGAAKGAVAAFNWVLAFLPVGMAWYFAGKVKEYLENKEEQGQYQPKATKNFMIVGAAIAGVFAAYVLVGLFGAVFLEETFATSWTNIVVSTWKDLFTV